MIVVFLIVKQVLHYLIIIVYNPNYIDIVIYEIVKSIDKNNYHVSYTYKQTSNSTINKYRSTFIYEIISDCKVKFINNKDLINKSKYITKEISSIYFKPNQLFKRLSNKKFPNKFFCFFIFKYR